MKILMVNKFFYIKGGSETYYFALKRLLEANGHEVIDFSMKDDKNFESKYSEYFVDSVDYNGGMSKKQQIKAAKNIIYSKEAKRKFEELVLATKPDIVHLHIFQHQLSPSILDICKKYNIPTVYTAHDLKMLCLNYVMMTNGQICEKCNGGHYINCFKQGCVKDSKAKSLINVVEGYLHKWRKSYDAIDRIITPSAFYRNKFIEFGVDENRVIHIPNCLDRGKPVINSLPDKEDYYLYFGRLSREKGVITLLDAVRGTDCKLKVVGTGPVKEDVEKYVLDNKLEPQVEILGFKSGQELSDIVGNAKAVILPSEWYENGPYSAIESLQLGRPIIGADIGGIPELVNGNGFIFASGDANALRDILTAFPGKESTEYASFCNKSEQLFKENYLASTHYEKLMPVYESAMNNKRADYA